MGSTKIMDSTITYTYIIYTYIYIYIHNTYIKNSNRKNPIESALDDHNAR